MRKTFNNDLLIDPATGEVRADFVRRAAEARAKSQYGADVTAADIEFWVERVTATAQALRAHRRAELGLPADEPVAFITPYGREVEGVRLSAF